MAISRYPFGEMIVGDEILCFNAKSYRTIFPSAQMYGIKNGMKFKTESEYEKGKRILWIIKRIA